MTTMCRCQGTELVGLPEAAEMLSVEYETMRCWVAKGVFPRVVRIGPAKRIIRLYRVDVEAEMRPVSHAS